MTDAAQLDWLTLLETHRPDYLTLARDAARKLLSERDWITVNDVRAVCPVPRGTDPRVLGAVFRHADFEPTGEFVRSGRGECHNRPIQKFRLTNFYHVHAALGMRR